MTYRRQVDDLVSTTDRQRPRPSCELACGLHPRANRGRCEGPPENGAPQDHGRHNEMQGVGVGYQRFMGLVEWDDDKPDERKAKVIDVDETGRSHC